MGGDRDSFSKKEKASPAETGGQKRSRNRCAVQFDEERVLSP